MLLSIVDKFLTDFSNKSFTTIQRFEKMFFTDKLKLAVLMGLYSAQRDVLKQYLDKLFFDKAPQGLFNNKSIDCQLGNVQNLNRFF